MDDLKTRKSQLRRQMRDLLRMFPPDRLVRDSAAVAERVLAMPEVQAARSVFCYVSMSGELATHDLIERLVALGKTVAAPVIVGGELEAHCIRGLADCEPDSLGIPTPRRPQPLAGSAEVSLTPGLAFSSAGQRLGRGKGYYDRFLSRHPRTLPIALALDEQVIDEVPVGADDRPVAWIVTPTRIIQCRGGG